MLRIRSGFIVRREWFGGILYNVRDIRERYYITDSATANILYAINHGINNITDIVRLLECLGYNMTKQRVNKIIKKLCELGLIFQDKESNVDDNESLRITLHELCVKLKKINELANKLRDKRILASPYLVTLNPTLDCNLNCIFCYSSHLRYEKRFTQPIMRFKDYIVLAKLLSEANVALIDIFGGEPLLHPDIDKILSELLEYDFNIVISTNAIYIPKGLLQILNRKGDGKVHINISIQSVDPQMHDFIVGMKGALNKAINNLFKLKDTGVSTSVGAVVTIYNIDYLEDLANWLVNHDIDQMILFYMHKVGRAFINNVPEIPLNKFIRICRKLEDKYKKQGLKIIAEGPFLWYITKAKIPKDPFAVYHYAGCHLKLKLEILPNGIITPCILLTEYIHSKTPITQIKDTDEFINLWLSFQEEIRKLFDNITECHKCKYSQLCKFSCRGYVYHVYKNIKLRDPRCPVKI